jgi:glycosyltransferase involved in cell wall biosynthesis
VLHPEFRRARYVFRSATAIVGVSDGYLEWGLRQAGRARGSWDAVFPHGYPRPTLAAAAGARARGELESLGVDPRRVVCCFVGSFGRSYDLGTVIEAARRLERAGRGDVQFVLAGDGERRAAWQRQAAGLSNVIFTGWLSGDAIAALLGLARIGLVAYAPRAPQGLPNKLFEYLSAGLPVVSSLRGETEGFLRETGCGATYPPGDAAALAALLLQLTADDSARREMGRRALARYDAEFAAPQVYGRLADHLERFTRSLR